MVKIRQKRVWPTIIGLLISLQIVLAESKYVPQIMKDFLRFLFKDLNVAATAGDDLFIIYAKLFLFFMLFAIFFFAGNKLFKNQRKISGTVALVVACKEKYSKEHEEQEQ